MYLKATQGVSYVDPTYQTRMAELKNSTLLHGAYHFFEPNKSAEEQAKHFVEQVKQAKHTLPPVLDIEITQEVPPEKITEGVRAWLTYVQEELKCQPMLYSYGSFWEQYLSEFNSYPFWLADYAKKPTPPDKSDNWRVWQYTDKARVPGIEHKVDENIIKRELTCHV